MPKRIYVDAAAATPVSSRAQHELIRLLNIYGNPSALHQEAVRAHEELDSARQKTAHAIGAHPDEMVFTSGGTEGNNLALMGVLKPLLKTYPTVHAITSAIEHPSVLEPLRALKTLGLHLTELGVNSAGLVSVDALRLAITEHTAVISIQFVNSEVGTIEPLREIVKEVRHIKAQRTLHHNPLPLYIHTDASQAPLWKTVQVEKLGIDLLTLDGQKILGPKGVGALFIRRGVLLEAHMLGGGQENGRRSGTENVALAGAFAIALEDAQSHEGKQSKKIAEVRNFLLQEILTRIPDVIVHGAVGDNRVANNLNISVPGLDGEMAVLALDALGIAASTRSACDQSDEEPSHVLVALGIDKKIIKNAIRLTLLPSATHKEAKRIATKLLEVTQRYRDHTFVSGENVTY